MKNTNKLVLIGKNYIKIGQIYHWDDDHKYDYEVSEIDSFNSKIMLQWMGGKKIYCSFESMDRFISSGRAKLVNKTSNKINNDSNNKKDILASVFCSYIEKDPEHEKLGRWLSGVDQYSDDNYERPTNSPFKWL